MEGHIGLQNKNIQLLFKKFNSPYLLNNLFIHLTTITSTMNNQVIII
jgi:hypothetical protein